MAINDFLAGGLKGRSQSTVDNCRSITKPIIELLGKKTLKRLSAGDVLGALEDYAATRTDRAYPKGKKPLPQGRSYSTVHRAHNYLERAIRFAQANDKIDRNVATLIDTPDGGSEGRPSKSFTRDQALAVLDASVWTRMDAYIHLGLTQGVRTEEERPLGWAEIDDDLDAEDAGFDVLRSVREKGKLKTTTSKRGLVLCQAARESLKRHQVLQECERAAAAELWADSGLVFTTVRGAPMDDNLVRKLFRQVLRKAAEAQPELGIVPEEWTPRDLRHTFVSLMSEAGCRSRPSRARSATSARPPPRSPTGTS